MVLTFIPIRHVIFPLRLLFPLLILIPRITIQISLLPFPLHRQIMAKLALPPLLAVPLLKEDAQDRLWVHAKRHFLHLHGLEELGRFPFRLFRSGLFLFALRLLRFLALLLGGFGVGGLGFYAGDLLL